MYVVFSTTDFTSIAEVRHASKLDWTYVYVYVHTQQYWRVHGWPSMFGDSRQCLGVRCFRGALMYAMCTNKDAGEHRNYCTASRVYFLVCKFLLFVSCVVL